MENTSAALNNIIENFSQFRAKEIEGRYITFNHIKPILEKLDEIFCLEEIGRSAQDVPIHSVRFGNGKIKVLAWSQMHGNESTTTKGVLDILNAFKKLPNDPLVKLIRENITLIIIPMLNPDGAFRYTRENANKIDLNRDALRLKEVESKLLRSTFKNFNPDFCFNLHDQRTIFSAGSARYPATLSFLTPAMDEKRTVYDERKISMQVIAAITSDLRKWLPNEIGRYNDDFNPNCTGDTFQSLGKPTILFEAGHSPGDYQREISRKYVTAALLSALKIIASGEWTEHEYIKYFDIPENQKLYYDVILRNALVNNEIIDIAIQFREVLETDHISFLPVIEKTGKSLSFYGHQEIECENLPITVDGKMEIDENVIVKNIYLNNEVLAINYQKI